MTIEITMTKIEAPEPMGCVCWYCHWGWAEPVALLYREYVERFGDESPMLFSIGHIVWEDENFDDDSIRWCLEKAENHSDYSDEVVESVRESLRRLLLEIPEHIRCCCPDEYDGNHPENFPPPAGIKTMHRSE